jgi:hypothetical protein
MNLVLRDMLVGPTILLAWSPRSKSAHRNLSSTPTLVFYARAPLPDALREERLTHDPEHLAIRTVLRGNRGDDARLQWDKHSGIASWA